MTSTRCPNCDTPVSGQYCSNCGQIQKDIRRFFLALVNESLDEIFSLNSRMWKTVVALLFRPGFLTNEYLRGRRASYVQPLRLYFITSIAFFLMLSLSIFLSSSPTLVLNAEDQKTEQAKPTSTEIEATNDLSATESLEAKIDADNSQRTDDLEQAFSEIDKSFEEDDFNVDLGVLSSYQNERLENLFKVQTKKAAKLLKEGDGSEIISVFLETVPPVIFCLLPLFAILLKVHYIFRGMYYTEHLIFAVHNHCFVFLILLISSTAGLLLKSVPEIADNLNIAIFLWIPVYLWFSLKRVYGQGIFFTTIKFFSLMISYGILLGIGMALTILIGIATI